jgi:hypothetical protein
LERLFHYILYVLDGKDAVLLSVGSSVVAFWDRSHHFTNRKSILFSGDRFLDWSPPQLRMELALIGVSLAG